ncbi:hypothetical protein [Mycolicibacterium sp.]|uniref:hypothetical protein n=1 Tax=Mycolicibacterium sp. TaxID=2320850 RepID=UPI00356007BE
MATISTEQYEVYGVRIADEGYVHVELRGKASGGHITIRVPEAEAPALRDTVSADYRVGP